MRIAAILFICALTAGAQDIEALKKAVADKPQDVNAHFDLALAYSIAGNDAAAIPEYRKVLELQPDLFEAQMNLGQVLLRAKMPAEAVTQLERAHQQKANEFPPAFYLAEALFDLGRFGEAVPMYEAAVKIDPKSAEAELGWGRSLAQSGKLDEAEPHYRNAAKLNPEMQRGLLELGQMRESKGDVNGAIAIYREFPQDPDLKKRADQLSFNSAVEAARSLLKEGKTKEADEIAARLVAADPQNYELRMFHARLLRDLHSTKEAEEAFLHAAAVKPDAAEVWSELAGVLILEEKYPEALVALDKVKALGAEGPGHMFFRATTLDRLKRKKEALEYYQRFLETSRTNPDQEFQARQRVRILESELKR
jgi:tetratricopeptide (TPR) repeat protein